jgi:hypothetical protein
MAQKQLMAMVAGIAMVGAIQTLQASISLEDLATTGATITIGDKTFSGFSYSSSGLVSFDPAQIYVSASESGGIDYLTWSGNISFTSSQPYASADLLLNYVVASSGPPIDMIDQAYTGSATGGAFLTVDETVSTGYWGGTVVGSSHLNGMIPSNPPTYANDVLNIVPPETLLYVTKDIGLATYSPPGGYDTISQVTQSFHQVPEPTTVISGALLLLPFGASALRILRKNRTA